MNFLAHIYLSGENENTIIGNFMADSIKGKSYQKYPPEIQKGILLHRAIDSFTDQHPTVKKSTARLHKNYGHFSGIIVDIFYDHFLAKNWAKYHPQKLEDYVAGFYELLRKNFETLPPNIQHLMPHMIADNWLVSYRSIPGIERILKQMNFRTKSISNMNLAVVELEKFYPEFEAEFTSFFEELMAYCKKFEVL